MASNKLHKLVTTPLLHLICPVEFSQVFEKPELNEPAKLLNNYLSSSNFR